MEKVDDIDMENHDAAGADNIEQSQKINLAEMPVEILERILVHLDDKSLLRASHVCTKFAAVAETAFAQKYSNEYCTDEGYSNSFVVMLAKYDDNIRKLEINVNEKDENETRLPKFFPRLKVFKIQNSVINLLENLSKHFCMQIEELSIDREDQQNDDDQGLDHGNDITHIIAKFKNLKSVHMLTTTMTINFDATHLMSVCPNLKTFQIQRHSNE